MSKIKVLFVVLDFYKAGAERFMYEIDRALDKDCFEISILCLGESSKVNLQWGTRYYEAKHRELGTNIMFIDRYLNQSSNPISRNSQKILKRLFKKQQSRINPKINQYLNQFDLLHWMGEYTLFNGVSEKNLRKSIIHVMSARFQYADLYKHFNHDYPYNFLSGFSDAEADFEFGEFRKIRHWRIPLLFKLPFFEKKWHFKKTENLRIGIFTRLSHYKPLDPFFYSFQLLNELLPNSELHIFGNGDPEKEGMLKYLVALGIRDKVFFRGHQEDITETVLKEEINLSWFQGYNNDRPAGYAGFDICATGSPLICWDFLEKPTNEPNPVYPHYKSISQFVGKSIEILTNPIQAEKLSMLQFNDVIQNRNVDTQIHSLEAIYKEVLELSQK